MRYRSISLLLEVIKGLQILLTAISSIFILQKIRAIANQTIEMKIKNK